MRKRQRRLDGVDELVLSLTAKGLTTGEVSAHLAEVYGAEVSKDTISNITDRVLAEMADWQSRPLDAIYPVVFVDAIHVKIRDGKVANRPIYTAVAVTTDGERDILGLWAGDGGEGGEGAKYWLHVLTELKNRGVEDVCIVVCDGLKGLPDAIGATWPLAVVQTCVLHLIRHTFRLAGHQHWDPIAKALRPVYTTPTEQAAKERFGEFTATWGDRYPGIVWLWENAWAEFVPFLAFEVEVRRVIFSTNAVESLNARFRRADRARGHSPATRPRRSASTSPCDHSTPPAKADNDGPSTGNQHSTPSPSCPKAASPPTNKPTRPSYTARSTVPSQALADVETSCITQQHYEATLARLLGVDAEGLLGRVLADLQPCEPVLELVDRSRAAGIRVVGVNGAGKTTLLHLALGTVKATSAPATDRPEPRGRSVGSSSTGASASRSRQ